ncbi:MAG: EamA family transporter [Lachnospiraceae bacterium]|nr:EamA family transporter [Lachnospiraceae bacterium]
MAMEMIMENERNERTYGGKGMVGAGGAMLSAFLYGLNAFFAFYAYQGGSNPVAFTCFSSFFSMAVLFLLMLVLPRACLSNHSRRRHTPLCGMFSPHPVSAARYASCIRVKFPANCDAHLTESNSQILPEKGQVLWLLADGVLGGLTTLFLFSAFEQMATGIATVLHFTYPVYVAVAGIWLLKKKLTVGKGAAMVLSLAGIAFTSDFSGAGTGTGLGVFLALASGLTYAGYILVMEKSGLQKSDYLWFSFYMTGIRGMVALLYGEAVGAMTFSMTGTAWMMTAAHALLTGVAANILFQFGVRHVGGTTASLLSMFEPVTCLAVGVMLLGEMMNPAKLFGCGMIMAGILVVVWDEHGKKTIKQ